MVVVDWKKAKAGARKNFREPLSLRRPLTRQMPFSPSEKSLNFNAFCLGHCQRNSSDKSRWTYSLSIVSWQDTEHGPMSVVSLSHISFNRSFKQASSRWRWRWTPRWGRGRRGGTTAWVAAMLPLLFSTSFLSLASASMLVVIVTIIDIIVLNFHGTQIVGKSHKDCYSMMDFVWKPSLKIVFQCFSTFTV